MIKVTQFIELFLSLLCHTLPTHTPYKIEVQAQYIEKLSKTQKGIQTIENTKSQEKNEKWIFKVLDSIL